MFHTHSILHGLRSLLRLLVLPSQIHANGMIACAEFCCLTEPGIKYVQVQCHSSFQFLALLKTLKPTLTALQVSLPTA